MRRSERETSYADAVMILRGSPYATVVFHDAPYPYAVPMHFGMTSENGAPVLYFHGASEGRKHALLARDNRVAFSAVRVCKDVPPAGGVACTAAAEFESVFGEGEMCVVTGGEAEEGLRLLLAHSGMTGEIPPSALAKVCVLKLTVKRLTGKRRTS